MRHRFATGVGFVALMLAACGGDDSGTREAPETTSIAIPTTVAPNTTTTAGGPVGQIAFTSDRSGNLDVWVMDADGTDPAQLTTDPGIDTSPAWSPDGTKIAFTSDRDGEMAIWVMNADGSGQVRLGPPAGWAMDLDGSGWTPPDLPATDPSWSPDGAHLAFVSTRGGEHDQAEVFVMNADGTDPASSTDIRGSG